MTRIFLFWCVVLFFVVAMIIRHILSQNSIIEGNENLDMTKVRSFKLTVSGHKDAVAGMLGGNKETPELDEEAVVDGEDPAAQASAAPGICCPGILMLQASCCPWHPAAPGILLPWHPCCPGTPAAPGNSCWCCCCCPVDTTY